MAGKRKRVENAGEVEAREVNSGSKAKQPEQFQGWLADVLVILRRWVFFLAPIPCIMVLSCCCRKSADAICE